MTRLILLLALIACGGCKREPPNQDVEIAETFNRRRELRESNNKITHISMVGSYHYVETKGGGLYRTTDFINWEPTKP